MHSGTKFFENPVKIQWCVASIFLRTPFRSHLVSSFVPKRNMQMCPPPNVLPCPAMCLPASKWFCVPRNCKVQRQDGDIHLALQLATDKGNHVFNRGSSIISQSDSRFASQPNRSRIAEKPIDRSLAGQIAPEERRCKQVSMQSLSQGIA